MPVQPRSTSPGLGMLRRVAASGAEPLEELRVEHGVVLAIAVARGHAMPEQLRRDGAHTLVAELQELL